MRPVKLVMSAFGPYRGKEIIHFDDLKDRKLFLVTGPTGAGKTTIFDAISFAMYGEASGDLRSAESLRSQFADSDCLTEVELTFELRGKTYMIHRIPRQQKPKTRGDGFTEQKSDASLKILSGDNVDAVVITGVKSVTEKIESVMGINAEQFRQIMMIPQGEFKKLLMADSQDREKVLQKLFDTQIYRAMQSKLDDSAKKLGNNIKGNRKLRDHELNGIDSGENQELKNLIELEDKPYTKIIEITKNQIESEQLKIRELEEDDKKLHKVIKEKSAQKEIAIQINKEFEELDSLKNKLELQNQMLDEFELKKVKLERAKKAKEIYSIEKSFVSEMNEFKSISLDLENINTKLSIISNLRIEAMENLKKEKSDEYEERRTKSYEHLSKLKSYVDKVNVIANLENDIKKLIEDEKIKKEQLTKTKEESKYQSDLVEKVKNAIEEAQNAKLELEKKRNEHREEKHFGEIVQELIQINDKLELEKQELIRIDEVKIESESRVKLAEENYTRGRVIYHTNQAAMLAQNLREGMPCPVCGAKEHIKLAEFSLDAIDQSEIEDLENKLNLEKKMHSENVSKLAAKKVAFDKVNESRDKIIEKVSKIEFEAEKLDKECLKLEVSESQEYLKEIIYRSNERITKITAEGKKIRVIADRLPQMKHDLEKEEKLLEVLAKKIDGYVDQLSELSAKLISNNTKLSTLYDEIPENMRKRDALVLSIEASEREYGILQKSFEDAKEKSESLELEFVAKEERKNGLNQNLAKISEKLDIAKIEYETAISKKGFEGESDYKNAQLNDSEMDYLDDNISEYETNKNKVSERLGFIKEKLESKTIQNIDEIEKLIYELEYEQKEVLQKKNGLERRMMNNKGHIDEAIKLTELMKEDEEKYNTIGHLARISKGENKSRMTFERYVLAAFLEDIIKAANQRLSKMSGGRYHLSRTEELERLNKQSGLELEVYDNYTGKSRHVKTLSGGESFKASLSMALGLSDFVQSYSGGVQLDTMFIDEGFGTLDQESLDSAINCLIELQEAGRLVGIISHVQELKERIDARLEVVASSTGSSTEFVIN
jgi:exonuclease SbcC